MSPTWGLRAPRSPGLGALPALSTGHRVGLMLNRIPVGGDLFTNGFASLCEFPAHLFSSVFQLLPISFQNLLTWPQPSVFVCGQSSEDSSVVLHVMIR